MPKLGIPLPLWQQISSKTLTATGKMCTRVSYDLATTTTTFDLIIVSVHFWEL